MKIFSKSHAVRPASAFIWHRHPVIPASIPRPLASRLPASHMAHPSHMSHLSKCPRPPQKPRLSGRLQRVTRAAPHAQAVKKEQIPANWMKTTPLREFPASIHPLVASYRAPPAVFAANPPLQKKTTPLCRSCKRASLSSFANVRANPAHSGFAMKCYVNLHPPGVFLPCDRRTETHLFWVAAFLMIRKG